MEMKTHFSFLKLYNVIKGVGKPAKEGEYDEEWINTKAPKAYRENIQNMINWCDSAGIWHPKVKYPVMFGKGDSAFPGMMATEDIGPNEKFISVPSE